MVKGCGGYFSKYASKGENGSEREKLEKWSKMYSPSRFWGSSHSIKKIIKENSFSFSLEMLNGSESEEIYFYLLDFLRDRTLLHYGEYNFKVEVERENAKKTIAQGFRQNFYVPPKDYQDLLSIFRLICPAFTVEKLRPKYEDIAS